MSRELMAKEKGGMMSWEDCLEPGQWEELSLSDRIWDMNDHEGDHRGGGEDGEVTSVDLMQHCILLWGIINHHQNMSNGISNVNEICSE